MNFSQKKQIFLKELGHNNNNYENFWTKMKFAVIYNIRDKYYGSEWQPSRVMNNKSAVFFYLT